MSKLKHCSKEQKSIWAQQQRELAKAADFDSRVSPNEVKVVAAADVSSLPDNPDECCAGVILMEFPSLKHIHFEHILDKHQVPYTPGFLAFREVPLIQKVWNHLINSEIWRHLGLDLNGHDLVMFADGNGRFHQRRCGMATHLGVTLDVPTIGVAKTLFAADGWHQTVLDEHWANREHRSHLVLHSRDYRNPVPLAIAMLSGNRGSRNPIFVSSGHRIDLDSAAQLTRMVCRTRIPAPISTVDYLTRRVIRHGRV